MNPLPPDPPFIPEPSSAHSPPTIIAAVTRLAASRAIRIGCQHNSPSIRWSRFLESFSHLRLQSSQMRHIGSLILVPARNGSSLGQHKNEPRPSPNTSERRFVQAPLPVQYLKTGITPPLPAHALAALNLFEQRLSASSTMPVGSNPDTLIYY